MLWHPSRAEGLGTSVIDAMSMGIPPIAFRVGGLPEVIDHGVSGVIAGAGDVEAFATGVSRLVEDRTWRELLAGRREGKIGNLQCRQYDQRDRSGVSRAYCQGSIRSPQKSIFRRQT